MATEAPAGNREIDAEPWTATQVRQNDERQIKEGLTALVAAVEHIPRGLRVAHNGLIVPGDRSRPVLHGITLVLKEHRDHRLGKLTQMANIQHLLVSSPEFPLILTNNADENRARMDVNEAVGFLPIAYEGAWKQVLA